MNDSGGFGETALPEDLRALHLELFTNPSLAATFYEIISIPIF